MIIPITLFIAFFCAPLPSLGMEEASSHVKDNYHVHAKRFFDRGYVRPLIPVFQDILDCLKKAYETENIFQSGYRKEITAPFYRTVDGFYLETYERGNSCEMITRLWTPFGGVHLKFMTMLPLEKIFPTSTWHTIDVTPSVSIWDVMDYRRREKSLTSVLRFFSYEKKTMEMDETLHIKRSFYALLPKNTEHTAKISIDESTDAPTTKPDIIVLFHFLCLPDRLINSLREIFTELYGSRELR